MRCCGNGNNNRRCVDETSVSLVVYHLGFSAGYAGGGVDAWLIRKTDGIGIASCAVNHVLVCSDVDGNNWWDN